MVRHRRVVLHIGRHGVPPQAVRIYRPPEPPPPAHRQTHPHRGAAHRGKEPRQLLERAARRSGPVALVGQDIAFGPRAQRHEPRAARDLRQHAICGRRGPALAARDIEQPLAPRAERLRTGARDTEFHRPLDRPAQGEDLVRHQSARRALRHRHRGDHVSRGVRADYQLAQTLGMRRDPHVALVGRRHARIAVHRQRPRLRPSGHDGLRHGALEHTIARQLAQRRLRHPLVERQRHGSVGEGERARRHAAIAEARPARKRDRRK